MINDILERAISILDFHGWTQGTSVELDSDRVCALGALYCAAHEIEPAQLRTGEADMLTPEYEKLQQRYRVVTSHVERTLFKRAGHTSISGYNDMPGRALEDVRDLFKETINDNA